MMKISVDVPCVELTRADAEGVAARGMPRDHDDGYGGINNRERHRNDSHRRNHAAQSKTAGTEKHTSAIRYRSAYQCYFSRDATLKHASTEKSRVRLPREQATIGLVTCGGGGGWTCTCNTTAFARLALDTYSPLLLLRAA